MSTFQSKFVKGVVVYAVILTLLLIVILLSTTTVEDLQVEKDMKQFSIPYQTMDTQLYFDESCSEVPFNYTLSPLKRQSVFYGGDKIKYDYSFILTNNEVLAGTFRYSLLFRTPVDTFGCNSTYSNIPYYADSKYWGAVFLPGGVNVTLSCIYILPESQDFAFSQPLIEPAMKKNCEPQVRQKNQSNTVNVTAMLPYPKVKVVRKNIAVWKLLFME